MDDPSDDTKIGSIDVRFALGDELAMFDWHARRGARMFTELPAASTPRLTVTHRAGTDWGALVEFDPPYSTLMNTGCVAWSASSNRHTSKPQDTPDAIDVPRTTFPQSTAPLTATFTRPTAANPAEIADPHARKLASSAFVHVLDCTEVAIPTPS